MKNKDFKSRLFNRIISKEDKDYLSYLFAETLFRLKTLDQINCDCSKCYSEKADLTRGLNRMLSYPVIKTLQGVENSEYRNCGRVKKK